MMLVRLVVISAFITWGLFFFLDCFIVSREATAVDSHKLFRSYQSTSLILYAGASRVGRTGTWNALFEK